MQSRAGTSKRLERIALYYFAYATLWILTSDWALGKLLPESWALGSLVKGLLFVAVTATLLHLLIRRASEREQAQALRARAVFAASSAGILVLDASGTLKEWNEAAAALFGLVPADEARRPVWTLLPGGTEEAWRELRDGVEGERELEMLGPGGTWFPALWRLRGASVGGAEMRVAYLEDLTASKVLERQLAQSQKMESVGRLAAGVTHDLNNLLSVILGHADALGARLPEGEPGRADLEGIQRTAGRAAALSRQLLTFSRQQLVRREPVDPNGLLLGLEPMLRGLVGENIALEIGTSPEPAWVLADPNRLEQVVVNLAVNARDAMPRGGHLLLEVRSRTLGPADLAGHPGALPGDFVQIRVLDTGEGMDEETLARIFDPFFTTKPPGQGTGLGLSMVYGLVQQFHGLVRVESRPGLGTDFRVLLPRTSEVPRPEEPAPASAPAEAPEALAILVVEDDPELRELVARLLERAGHRVLGAGSGPEAFRLLQAHPEGVDLLLTDLGLPGMDGRELARRFQEEHPGTPVLLMSAYAVAPRSEGAQPASEVRMLEKPFTGAQLLEQVRRAVNSRPEA